MKSSTRKNRKSNKKRFGGFEPNNEIVPIPVEQYIINGPISVNRPRSLTRSSGKRNVFRLESPDRVEHISYGERNQIQRNTVVPKRYSIRNGTQFPASIRTLRNTLVTMPSARQSNLLNAYFKRNQ
jgi:hypothetical protein